MTLNPPESSNLDENWQKAVIDRLDYGIAVCQNDNLTLVQLNPAFADLQGYKVEQLQGKSLESLVYASDWPIWQDHLRRVKLNEPQTWQANHRSASGKPLRVNLEVQLLDASEKRYIITLKLAKSAILTPHTSQPTLQVLRESEKQLRQILENIQEVFYIVAPNNAQMLYLSPAYEQIWGESSHLVYHNVEAWLNQVHPEDRESLLNYLDTNNMAEEFNQEYRIIRPDGEIRWIWDRAFPAYNEQGDLEYYVGIAEDITERKQAEQQLTEAKMQYQAILKGSQEGFLIVDGDGRIVEVNDAYCQMLGYTREELLQLTIADVETLEYRQPITPSSVNPHQMFSDRFETRHRDKRGNILEIEASMNYLPNCGYIFTFVKDVTKRKQAEDDLRREREFKSQVLDHLPIGIAVHTTNYDQQLYMNDKFGEIYGISPEKQMTIEQLFETIFPDPQDRQQRIEQILADVESRDPKRMQWEDVVIHGGKENEKIICAKNIPLYDQNLMISTVWDVTPQKKAEEELRESEERFRAIFEQAAVGMAIVAPSGQFLRVNQKLCDLTGYSESALLNLTFLEITHPEEIEKCTEKMQQMLSGEFSTYSLEKRQITSEGHIRWVNSTVSLLKNAQNVPQYFIAIIENIQDRKETQWELQQAKESAEAANRAKSQFLANMSHELRTPLNAILGFTQLMMRSSQTPDKHYSYLEVISRSGEHLLALINDVLDLSKIEAGKTQLNSEKFNLHLLVANIVQMFRLKAQEKKLDLQLAIAANVPQWIETDAQKLRSTLINLLNNAIKFTDQGSVSIKVNLLDDPALQPHQKRLFFTVEDTGIGIDASDLETLFEAFVQTPQGQTLMEGTGLGLAISRSFVRMMGGDIRVQSVLGQGSTFSFDIIGLIVGSLHSCQDSSKIVGLAPNQPDYRILVVEDHATNGELLVNLLKSIGFTVELAQNGQIALEKYQSWQPHLIWMDMRMPIMDGYEATRRIRQLSRDKSPVIIALTATVLESQQIQMLAIGCDDVVFKPYRQSVILEKMAQHLGAQYLYE